MRVPFTKAHGAKNDFLLTWTRDVPPDADLPGIARAICERSAGVGADGWLLVADGPAIRLFNSDGSEPELSGNGTRCAAAFLIAHGHAGEEMDILTGAGPKHLRLVSRHGREFTFEMGMGRPRVMELHFEIAGRDATSIDCGNPQCALLVENFDFDWMALGAEIERHPHFPNRTNVSFIRPVDEHTIDVRFFERGAGFTMSSGTGSTGAAVCAMARGIASSPVRVLTLAGPLDVVSRDGDIFLTGPAAIVADGVYYCED